MKKYFTIIFLLGGLTSQAQTSTENPCNSCANVARCEYHLSNQLKSACNRSCTFKSCIEAIRNIAESSEEELAVLKPYIKQELLAELAPKIDALKKAQQNLMANVSETAFGQCFLDWLKATEAQRASASWLFKRTEDCKIRNSSLEKFFGEYDGKTLWDNTYNYYGDRGDKLVQENIESFRNTYVLKQPASVTSQQRNALDNSFVSLMKAMKDIADRSDLILALREIDDVNGRPSPLMFSSVYSNIPSNPDVRFGNAASKVLPAIKAVMIDPQNGCICLRNSARRGAGATGCIDLDSKMTDEDHLSRWRYHILPLITAAYETNASKLLKCPVAPNIDTTRGMR